MITTQAVFNLGSGFNGVVHSCAFRSDGYLYVAGEFTTYKGLPAPGICRLTPSGDLDDTFSVGTGFTSNATYYPPSQLFPTNDGGVMCVLGKTHTKLLVTGRTFVSLRFNGVTVAPIVKLSRTGGLVTEINLGVVVGDIVSAAVVVRDIKICYILEGNPTIARMVRFADNDTYEVSCAMAGAWKDVTWTGREDARIVLVGPTLTVLPTRTEPMADTFTTVEWPLGLKVQLLEESLEPSAKWVAAVGTGGDREARIVVYSEAEQRLYVGQKLELTTAYGQWNDSFATDHRGMYGIGLTGYSEWDLPSTGFEPYQNTIDNDGYPIVSIPLTVHVNDGRVFAVAPFGTLGGASVGRHRIVAVKRNGTQDNEFSCPALTNSDSTVARVACGAVAPSGEAVFIGGRFNELAGDAVGHSAMLDAETGVMSNNLRSIEELVFIAYTGSGVRNVVWSGFGEGIYVAKSDK